MTIEKLDMHTPDITDANVARIAELFPNVVTEGKDDNGNLVMVVDFDALKQELSGNIIEGPQERYRLDWPGKREAMLAANTPITKTLRPVREESVDFDKTKNLFIEGDNLDALKLLQETYLGKVKMIYIDPPYNTGKDFIYKDNFTGDKQEYLEESGQVDQDSGKLVANLDSNGRYHSDWLSMMYPRLKLARNLLRDDGVIFISIDDVELYNLKGACDSVFGQKNYCGVISRATGTRMGQGSTTVAKELDYVLIYSKTEGLIFDGLPMTKEDLKIYDLEDDKGRYLIRSMRRTGGENRREDRPSMYYPVAAPDGTPVYPIAPAGYESRWVCSEATYHKMVADGLIDWKFDEVDGVKKWKVYQRTYVGDALKQPSNLWNSGEGNKKATKDLNALFSNKKVFDHPKPNGFMKKLIELASNDVGEQVFIDFFAGSGSSAHGTMLNNLVSKKQVRYICVQLPEELNEGTKSQKVAYDFCTENGLNQTIAEISKERIRRAGKKILEDNPNQINQIDVGFRVLKIDDSNMNDVYYSPSALEQTSLLDTVEHIKPDRTAEDLLFQVMLDWGVDLSLPIKRETLESKTIYWVGENDLAACFDMNLSEALVKAMAAKKPLRAVFRDDGFATDDMKINAGQLFKQMTDGHTDMKVV